MSTKSLDQSGDLYDYIVSHGSEPPDEVLRELQKETEKVGLLARMQIDAEQGALLTWLTRAFGVRRAIEIGTFTGYSSLCIARGLPEDGALLCLDVSEEWTSIAQRYWERAGLSERIELRLAPASETLEALPMEESFDLAFIDADKTGYASYLELLLPRMRTRGVILVDNVLWNGAVIDPAKVDPDTEAIRAFNDQVAEDPRLDAMMLGRFDGLTLIRKR
ncbi:MAG: class I SAM-dependent methyltransferase [Deltaproteobacteria bacterium]|nr:class I SAM-dependent methyltransferase [Deltaproteobacteria bacterium]MBW2393034.1 class I SAM-dependent methyltransferase [Deltaproteobacteria bacterium]